MLVQGGRVNISPAALFENMVSLVVGMLPLPLPVKCIPPPPKISPMQQNDKDSALFEADTDQLFSCIPFSGVVQQRATLIQKEKRKEDGMTKIVLSATASKQSTVFVILLCQTYLQIVPLADFILQPCTSLSHSVPQSQISFFISNYLQVCPSYSGYADVSGLRLL